MNFAALDLVPVFEWGYETIMRHLQLALKSLLSYHSRISCHHLTFECISVLCHVFVLTVFQVNMHNRFRIYFFSFQVCQKQGLLVGGFHVRAS